MVSKEEKKIYPLHGKKGCFVIKIKGKYKVLYPRDIEKAKKLTQET